MAVELSVADLVPLLEAIRGDFYVPEQAARDAVADASSFNAIDLQSALKVDFFVLGVVLRKLEWYVAGGRASDRQWRDVVGVLRVQGDGLDSSYLDETAEIVGLADKMDRARGDASGS